MISESPISVCFYSICVGTQVQGSSADEDTDDAAQKTTATEKGALKVREKKRT